MGRRPGVREQRIWISVSLTLLFLSQHRPQSSTPLSATAVLGLSVPNKIGISLFIPLAAAASAKEAADSRTSSSPPPKGGVDSTKHALAR